MSRQRVAIGAEETEISARPRGYQYPEWAVTTERTRPGRAKREPLFCAPSLWPIRDLRGHRPVPMRSSLAKLSSDPRRRPFCHHLDLWLRSGSHISVSCSEPAVLRLPQLGRDCIGRPRADPFMASPGWLDKLLNMTYDIDIILNTASDIACQRARRRTERGAVFRLGPT